MTSSCARDEPCDGLGGGPIYVGEDVGVDVSGEGHARVTKQLRDELEVFRRPVGQRCRGVSQVMEADRWQPGRGRQGLRVMATVLRESAARLAVGHVDSEPAALGS